MKIKLSKFSLFILLLSLITFFSLRLLVLDKLPVFVDEAIYVRWAQIMKNEATLRFLPQSDGKQPLFMWLVIPALKIFSDPLVAGRIVSVTAGFFTLVGTGLLTFILTKNLTTSAFACLLYALTPFMVFFDRMALADSLLTTFAIWSLVVGALFVRYQRLDLAMILGFILGGGLLTKSPAVIFYFWQLLLAIFFFQFKKHNFLKLISGWLVAGMISQVMFNILRLGPNFHLINSRNQDYLYSFKEILTHPFVPLIYNIQNSFSWMWLLLSASTIILIFTSVLSKKYRLILFLLSVFSLPFLSQASVAKVYTSRYLLFFIPLLIILAAIGLDFLQNKMKRVPLFIVFLIMPLFLSLGYVFRPEKTPMSFDMRSGYLEEWTAGTGQKEIAEYLIDQANNGAKIVVGTEGSFGTLPDGLQIYTENRPNITVIGVGLPIFKLADSLLNTSAENQIYFVVNKSRNKLDQSEVNKLKLIASYPKAERTDGSREELQFYQLLPQALNNND